MKARLALAVVLLAGAARAQHPDDVEQAKALFAAGAAAYDQHDYVGAIRAFEGAERAAPRPAIVFSLAQAHRRQFYVDGNSEHQRAAVDLFRDYVTQVPTGGRHEDAMRALQELGALTPQKDATSLSINSSGTSGARISVDGAPAVGAPLIGPVKAGPHHVVITADGYVTEQRDVVAVDGRIIALDVPLKEQPARVRVTAASGALVLVDGRTIGEAPLTSPLELPPGAHTLAVSKNGHEAYQHEVALGRGEQRTVDVALPLTKQRKVATGLLVSSGIVVVGAATCAVIAAVYLGQANHILNEQTMQNITQTDVDTYNTARDSHTGWLTATAAGFATAGALAATGLVLFLFDKPTLTTTSPDERRPKPQPKTEPLEARIVPLVSPTTVGAFARVTF